MLPPNYSEMTDQEKVHMWAFKMHQWMRWAGESNHDEIEALDRDILLQSRAHDKDFDRFMPRVLAILARTWSVDRFEFLKQVNAQMNESFEYDEEEIARLYPADESSQSSKRPERPWWKLF